MALGPSITATGDTDPIGISGKQDGTIQDAQSGIVEMCFEPSRFDQILRIDECHKTPPCVSLPYADELTPNDRASADCRVCLLSLQPQAECDDSGTNRCPQPNGNALALCQRCVAAPPLSFLSGPILLDQTRDFP